MKNKYYYLFNLDEIEKSLRDVSKKFSKINDLLDNRREPITGLIIKNILETYEYLNGLLTQNIDIFSHAGLYSLLELNHIILCGREPAMRREYHSHLFETRNRFQERIEPIYKWYKKNHDPDKPFETIADIYVKILSQPQLYLEGNHRTGNIIINYILMSFKLPPFILDSDNAVEYLNISTKIKFSNKNGILTKMFSLKDFEKEFRKIMEKYISKKYCLE